MHVSYVEICSYRVTLADNLSRERKYMATSGITRILPVGNRAFDGVTNLNGHIPTLPPHRERATIGKSLPRTRSLRGASGITRIRFNPYIAATRLERRTERALIYTTRPIRFRG